MEVKAFGIRSAIVQPGGTQSSWGQVTIDHIAANLKVDSPYQELANDVSQLLKGGAVNAKATSKDLAQVFYCAATDKTVKRRYFNSFEDRANVVIARSFPNFTNRVLASYFKRISRRAGEE
ncbi:MAG: hypothetical protein LBI43_05675 [Streptococcaceae bacterium]|jgi:hypothetical protein|nr:hypothetical protein [Streptococcaceae bacterium]